MGWICGTAAPWALAAGLLVSFTASAGQDISAGVSFGPGLSNSAILDAGNLVPAAPGLIAQTLGLPRTDRIQLSRLPVDDPLPPDPAMIGVPPRDDLKQLAKRGKPAFPEVVRKAKGDPLVGLKPSLSRRGIETATAEEARRASHHMVFMRNERMLPPTVLMEGSLELPPFEAMTSFEPWSTDSSQTREQTAAASPGARANAPTSDMTADPKGLPDAIDGATPPVPRAVAIESTTPAPADATPMAIAAAPVAKMLGLDTSVALKGPEQGRPNYAALIEPDRAEKELQCLAEAVYFEARSEPETGQAAVAQVVLNRVKSGLYPTSVCGVVYQNRHRYKACQFTFACEGKALIARESDSWQTAVRVARQVSEGTTYLADVGGATHYHADYVRPRWARKLRKMDVIGRHIFYKLKPGQT